MPEKNIKKSFKISPEEYDKILSRMKSCKMSFSKYVRTMALEGEIVILDSPEYQKVILEMNRIGNNFNQIARRLNETGSFYYDDLIDMKEEHEKLCLMLSQYLSTLRLKKV